jgi:hypothetical protein
MPASVQITKVIVRAEVILLVLLLKNGTQKKRTSLMNSLALAHWN